MLEKEKKLNENKFQKDNTKKKERRSER